MKYDERFQAIGPSVNAPKEHLEEALNAANNAAAAARRQVKELQTMAAKQLDLANWWDIEAKHIAIAIEKLNQ